MLRSSRPGFTLMEGLYVVMAIALFIAILLPSLAAARHKAACATVLKQVEICSAIRSELKLFEFDLAKNPPPADVLLILQGGRDDLIQSARKLTEAKSGEVESAELIAAAKKIGELNAALRDFERERYPAIGSLRNTAERYPDLKSTWDLCWWVVVLYLAYRFIRFFCRGKPNTKSGHCCCEKGTCACKAHASA